MEDSYGRGSVGSRTWPPFRDPRHILQGRPGRGLIRSARALATHRHFIGTFLLAQPD
jgi:hypothetical protein